MFSPASGHGRSQRQRGRHDGPRLRCVWNICLSGFACERVYATLCVRLEECGVCDLALRVSLTLYLLPLRKSLFSFVTIFLFPSFFHTHTNATNSSCLSFSLPRSLLCGESPLIPKHTRIGSASLPLLLADYGGFFAPCHFN